MTSENETQPDPESVPIAVAMSRVMRDVGAIGKNRRNEGQGYNFRGIDDLMNHLHPVLCRHGVIVVPTGTTDRQVLTHERTTASGRSSVSTQVFIRQAFRFYGPQGDYIEAEITGEGADTADKATNKANSSAFKYLLLETFTIPLDDMEDSDRETPTIERGASRPGSGSGARAQRRTSKQGGSSGSREATRKRDELRETISGLPDDVRASVAAYLTEHRINLKRDTPSVTELQAIEAFIAAQTEAGASDGNSEQTTS